MEGHELAVLFTDVLPSHYGWRKKVETVDCVSHEGIFAIHDESACERCKELGRNCDNPEVAKFQTGKCEVYSYEIEAYLDIYAQSYKVVRGVKCDFVHFDANHEKFVLNELTCSRKQFVEPFSNSKGPQEGKREHARRQMEAVSDILCQVPELNGFIQSFGERIALFSWRNQEMENTLDKEERTMADTAMTMFLEPLESVADIREMAGLSNGFCFVQQLYPAVFSF